MVFLYQRLLSEIEVIEAVSIESDTFERLVYHLNVKRMKDPDMHKQIELFNQIVSEINRLGLGAL